MKTAWFLLAGIMTLAAAGAAWIAWPAAHDPVHAGRNISAWVLDLAHADHRARSDAKSALRSAGSAAVPQLRSALTRRDLPFQGAAERLVRRFPFIPVHFVHAAVLRAGAAAELGHLGAAATPALPALIRVLRDDESSVAEEAEGALRRLGRIAAPELIATLDHSDPSLRACAARVLKDLGEQGRPALPKLAGRVRDPDSRARTEIVRALGHLGRERALTVPILITVLSDPSPGVRSAAAEALGLQGLRAAEGRDALTRALRDRDAGVRVESARALWRIDPERVDMVPVLVQALDEPAVGWRAALLLGDIGASASSAVPGLIKAMKAERVPRPLRSPPASALALGRIGAAAVPGLLDTLGHADPSVRTSAVIALGLAGPAAHESVPALFALMRDPDPEVRTASALSLGSIDPANQRLVPVLKVLSLDEDVFIRGAALSLLVGIDPAAAAEMGPE